MKSEYTSNRDIAGIPTIPIAVDDPRLGPFQKALTKATIGGPIDEIGVDGKSITAGGTFFYAPSGGANVNTGGSGANYTVPGDGGPAIDVGFNPIVPIDVTSVVATWSSSSPENLIVNFDWDYADPANATISEFILEVTANGITRTTPYRSFFPNKTQTAQTLTLTKDLNRQTFGQFRTSITSVCVYAIDSFYNKSSNVCDTSIPAYVLDLPVPVITVTAAVGGYNVAYTIPTQEVFDAIDIVEYESNASTEPTGVSYLRVYFNSISPANIITTNTNPRWVKARFSSDGGIYTEFSAAQKITPTPAVTVDTTGPDAPSTGSATAGVDNSTGATVGFNAYVDISWSAVSDATLRGYRIRFRENGTSNPFSYVNSPGTGTSFRLNGLAIGTVYEVAIASYDQFNNTSSSYFSIGTAQATGTPFIGKNVTTVGYFGASATGDTGTFKFGYGVQDSGGVKRGLVFNSNNYWYIDSAQSALFKLGGDTNNYIQWDGQDFNVAGNITARGGSFTGNVLLNGGSLYAIGAGGSASSGIRTIFNSSGIAAYNASGGYTTILTQPLTDGSVFVTTAANIGGWTINENEIKKVKSVNNVPQGTISLNSTQGYIAVSADNVANLLSGINTASSADSSVFWAGSEATSGVSSSTQISVAPFRVSLSGDLYSSSAFITGDVKAGAGGFGTIVSNAITKGWLIDESGLTAVGGGQIKLGNYSIETLTSGGTDFSIKEYITGQTPTTIIRTDSASNVTTDAKRVFLGDLSRQVEVAKSAGVWPLGTTATLEQGNETALQQYRSGGLRNMFTVTKVNLTSNETSNGGEITLFPSAYKGDVLIVWDTSTGGGGDWKKAEIWLKADGTTATPPTIATSSTITTGNSGASIVVTSTGFKTTAATTDFTISAGTTGLTLSSITNTSTTSKTLVFTGTVTAGTLQITAKTSAFNPAASSVSNTLSLSASGATTYTVPNVIGLSPTEAASQISASGNTYGGSTNTTTGATSSNNGLVATQSIAAGVYSSPQTVTVTTYLYVSAKRCTEFDVANQICGPSDFNLCDNGGCGAGADCTDNIANRCYVE